jgi:hypothetical protein
LQMSMPNMKKESLRKWRMLSTSIKEECRMEIPLARSRYTRSSLTCSSRAIKEVQLLQHLKSIVIPHRNIWKNPISTCDTSQIVIYLRIMPVSITSMDQQHSVEQRVLRWWSSCWDTTQSEESNSLNCSKEMHLPTVKYLHTTSLQRQLSKDE